jgi:mycoredoxin-dependent peroxiredoxin
VLDTRQPELQIGVVAPEFCLRDQFGQEVRLSDHRGHTVLVVFFPYAFTPTCTGELADLRDHLVSADVARLAVSCDSGPSLKVFGEQEHIEFPLLSDFWPHGEVARRYGVFHEERGFALRGTFLVDRDGVLRWRTVRHIGERRDVGDYRRALAEL